MADIIADINQIIDVLPHRYPFLLVDKVVELQDNQFCAGIKNVSFNEPQFQGHFPDHPIMPGVMLVEAMAQVATLMKLLPLKRAGEPIHKKVVYFMSFDDAKFRHPVVPGDILRIETEKIHSRKDMWKSYGKVIVNDKVYAEAKLNATLRDK